MGLPPGARARVEQRLERIAGSIVEFTTLSRVNAPGADDQAHVAGHPADRQRPVRRVAPWGLSGRPVAGVLAAVVKAFGGAFNGLAVGIATDRYGPQDLNEGETCLWNKGTARVLLDQNDQIGISGKLVQVNGGDHPLPKWDTAEADIAGALTAALSALATPCVNGKALYTPSVPPAPDPIRDVITKLKNGAYESTKAKNG